MANVDEYMQQKKLMLQLVKEGLKVAQKRMKILADKGIYLIEFLRWEIGFA